MENVTLQFSLNELLLMEKTIGYDAPRTVLNSTILTDGDLTNLALLVGNAIRNVKNDSADLTLTEHQCWFFREVINITDRISGKGEQAEGLMIKGKLYDALADFDVKHHSAEIPQLDLPQAKEVTYASHPSENPNQN